MKSLYEQMGGTYHMGKGILLSLDFLVPAKGKYGRIALHTSSTTMVSTQPALLWAAEFPYKQGRALLALLPIP